MDARISSPRYPLLVLLCTVCALSGTRSPAAAAGRSCADTRQVYSEKGYSTGTAPQTQISGKTVSSLRWGGGGINYTMKTVLGLMQKSVNKYAKFKLIITFKMHAAAEIDASACSQQGSKCHSAPKGLLNNINTPQVRIGK